jgi:hypothetical protein
LEFYLKEDKEMKRLIVEITEDDNGCINTNVRNMGFFEHEVVGLFQTEATYYATKYIASRHELEDDVPQAQEVPQQ